MTIELWERRIILDGEGRPKRFTFFNPQTGGLGSFVEFSRIRDEDGAKILDFRCDLGEGRLWISGADGQARDPFFHRTWFLGQMVRQGKSCIVRFRFIDEHSGGSELGTRVFTQWQPGEWKTIPEQDAEGHLTNVDPKFYFGWSVNGNAYHWEPKPAQPAEEKKEVKKVPKTFGGVQSAVGTGQPAEVSPKTEEVQVKKPKVFVPKAKQTGETSPTS